MDTHKDAFPFACDHCPQRFEKKCQWKRHQDVHRAASHVCPECDKPFKSAASLRRHRSGGHRSSKYRKCNHCEKYFLHLKDLYEHAMQHDDYTVSL